MSGWVVLVVGVVLCFLGVGSVHLAILASAFGLGWLLGDLFGATDVTSLIIAAGTALIAWALVTLVFKAARFVVGLITGALIGARLYAIFSAGGRSAVLAVVVVLATAIVFGFLADRYKGRVLLWATAIGGAGLVLSSLGRIWPDALGFLHHPQAGVEQVTSTVLWAVLAGAGWFTQRRLFPKALNLQDAPAK